MTAPTLERAPGNAEVVALLEEYLAKAKQGRASYCVVGLCGSDARHDANGAGVNDWIPVARELCDRMSTYLGKRIMNMQAPIAALELDASYVCYNIPAAPLSYDFIPWLVNAEMTRRSKGGHYPLKVGFYLGEDGKTGLDLESRRRMFWRVVKPALCLIGAVESKTALLGRCVEFYSTRYMVEAYRCGEAVPKLGAPWIAKDKVARWLGDPHKKPVTITLREAEHWPHRNSNWPAWKAFISYLVNQGERVVVVRDTSQADKFLELGYGCGVATTYREASECLWTRQALYESAKANLFVSNGPWSLALFGSVPWLCFTQMREDGFPYNPDTPKNWRENMGVEIGGQYPWSTDKQRIVWAPDTYDNIVEAWEELAL